MSNPWALAARLAALRIPEEQFPVRSASDLLLAFVAGCDSRGRYYGSPKHLRRLIHWADVELVRVEAWRDELVERGDLMIRPDAIDIFTGDPVDVAYLLGARRFQRFQNRRKITPAERATVFLRDGYRCVTCGARDKLTVDHIHPWSRNGIDADPNFQTMCESCNSRKGNRV